METYTELKDFVNNPHYHKQMQECLNRLDMNTIDTPIIQIIEDFLKLPYCFTLQSCYGHFLYNDHNNSKNFGPLTISDSIKIVEYRIAYIALCIENSDPGRRFFSALREIPAIDLEYIQFGCAEWFWERQVNSYILQIEPNRFKTKDKISISYQEALYIEKTRNEFFNVLKKLIQKRLNN